MRPQTTHPKNTKKIATRRKQDTCAVTFALRRGEGPFDKSAALRVEFQPVNAWLKFLADLLIQERLRELAERSDPR
jgi:hypothetical protein